MRQIYGVLIATVLLVGGIAGCGSGGESVVCGELLCGPTQFCDSTGVTPVCICREGYTGSDCASCEPAYMQQMNGACTLRPIDCALGNSCGTRGQCVPAGGAGLDYCACNPEYAGVGCASCAATYQDKDNNGTCTPACLNPKAATCIAPQVCNDATGTARCECPAGKTGATCDRCLAGHVLQANGSCIMCAPGSGGEGCAQCDAGFKRDTTLNRCVACPQFSTGANCTDCVAGFGRDPQSGMCVAVCSSDGQCGANGFCDKKIAVPACACKPGFAGANCAGCAAGYAPDGAGNCIAVTIPAGTTMLGAGTIAGAASLLAINPAAGTATPIRPLPANTPILQLAADIASKTLFAVTSQGIHVYNLQTGALTLITANVAQVTNLAFGGTALFTIPNASPYLLKRINPNNGAIADLPATTLSGVQGLAFDVTSQSLIAARWAANGPDLYRVPIAGGAGVALGPVLYDGMPLAPPSSQVGLVIEPGTAALYAAAKVGREAQSLLKEHCAKVITGVGLAGYEQAMYTTMALQQAGVGANLTRVLTSGASGKEVIAYASQVTRGATPGILRIETTNPESVVCITTSDENLKLVLAANAVFAGIVFSGNRPALALEMEGVREVLAPMIHVYATTQTYVQPVAQFAIVKLYTNQEWLTQRMLPATVSLWGTDPLAPTRLMQLNLQTLKPIRFINLQNVELQHVLAPWVP